MDMSSFSEMLRRQAPHLLPAGGTDGELTASNALPHGTTIVAIKFPGGVLIAGDRRSTQGNMIAGRDVQKIHVTDDYTATGIAGTAAIAVEFARLYAVELEHYEKLEGVALTFAGKVNRLAIMVRGNLGAALQGFVALPLLVGYDLADPNSAGAGRIVSFDAAGGWNVELEGYQSVGSGSIFAKSSIKKLYSRVTDANSALGVAIEALYDARGRRLGDRRPRPGARHLPDGSDHSGRRCGGSHRGTNRPTRPRGNREPFPRRVFRHR